MNGKRMTRTLVTATAIALGLARGAAAETGGGGAIEARLTEWAIRLSPAVVTDGRVTFRVRNAGSVPHALEIEGKGIEKETHRIAAGEVDSLSVTLAPGEYEVYCPVGSGSHEKLGMHATLKVRAGGAVSAAAAPDPMEQHDMSGMVMDAPGGGSDRRQVMEVTGGGPVIQILPGPFPFADSASAVIESRPSPEREDLLKKAQVGPYSNNVLPVAGTFSLTAIDHGASGDSVSGAAEIATQEGIHWRIVLDRVQTKDIPNNPRFGGVIMSLYYHGASGVHTPLVPTIQSSLALWVYAHVYREGKLVTGNAMVHVMLLSRTRREGDFHLACWDCSRNRIDELQLQVTAAPGTPPLPAPGGFLFVNWENSSGIDLSAQRARL